MKRVTFEIAKALKEAGYPQYGSCDEYYNHNGQVVSKFCDINKLIYPSPTYMEVWLWLWREKKIRIEFNDIVYKIYDATEWVDNYGYHLIYLRNKMTTDPEESIIEAIEYLIDNDLIK